MYACDKTQMLLLIHTKVDNKRKTFLKNEHTCDKISILFVTKDFIIIF